MNGDSDLPWALEIHANPFRNDPEVVHKALSVLRYWRIELKAELRGVPRKSERYAEVKKQEERLEAACLDLNSALMVQMNARKFGG